MQSVRRIRRKRHIAGVAIETRTTTGGVEGGRTTLYVHKDHLGSLDVITDASGGVVQELSFDAWGQRRNATTWAALSTQALIGFDHSLTTRGFTGHEMLDEVGLIHMNGRVYDPKLARFLQADPIIQDPTNSQSLNRYSYVWNNPLNATDPSGYFVFGLIAAAIWAAVDLTITQVVALFAFSGFADTLIAGGSFKDALLAGISSAAFAGVGAKLGGFSFGLNVETVSRVAAFGTLGGVTSILQGGKFGHGFRYAGLSALTGGIAGKVSRAFDLGKLGQGVARMVAAGTVSELSGGKFANGAATAAFRAAVVSLASSNDAAAEDLAAEEAAEKERRRATLQKELSALKEKGTLNPYQTYDSADEAATAVLDVVAPLSEKYGFELGGHIEETKFGWRYTMPEIGTESSIDLAGDLIAYHTHPDGPLMFSNQFNPGTSAGDAGSVATTNKDLYLGVLIDGDVAIGVCSPGACPNIGRLGTAPSRILE